jgi:hypothetical protein
MYVGVVGLKKPTSTVTLFCRKYCFLSIVNCMLVISQNLES